MLKKYFRETVILACIVLIALVIRTISLDSVPYGAHVDEASWGYNASSILATGKDEFGITLPLIFTAYGDQKLPIYTYLIVPFVKWFGLSNLAVRLPGALAGSILCIGIYLFLRSMQFGKRESLIGAIITATSPWLIILSRVFGLDSGVGLLFFVLGIWLARLSLHRKYVWLLVFAGISFGLTWYSYIAYRVASTCIILLFVLMYYRSRSLLFRRGAVLLGVYLVTVLPLIFLSSSGKGTSRFWQVLSTPTQGMVLTIDEDRGLCAKSVPQIVCYLNSNKAVAYASKFIGRNISALSPPYLFLEGDKELKFMHVDGYALMYLSLLPFYLAGLIFFIQKIISKQITKDELFIFLGLFLTPLPALIVSDAQKVRISSMYPFVLVTCMYGFSHLSSMFTKEQYKRAVPLLLSFVLSLNLVFFMVNFLHIHVKRYEISFHQPVAKLMQYLGQQGKEVPIYIKSIDEAIVLYSYYNAVDPAVFQTSVQRPPLDHVGFSHATNLINIHRSDKNFDQIYCEAHARKTHALIATNENLTYLGKAKKAKKIIFTEGNVHEIYYVFDTRDIYPKGIDCVYLLGLEKKK